MIEDLHQFEPDLGIDPVRIAEAYDYQIKTPRELFPLNLDWSKLATGLEQELFTTLKAIQDGERKPDEISTGMEYHHVIDKALPCPFGEVQLKLTEANPTSRYGKKSITIQLEFKGETIGNFLVYPSWGSWEIFHRIIEPEFRGQGIGSQMTKILEAYVQAKADENAKEQDIEIEVGQVDVLNFYLRKGYEIDPRDYKKFSRISSSDPSLCLIDDTVGDRNMFIFEKSKVPASPEEFDEDDSLRIRLSKNIHPAKLKFETLPESTKLSDFVNRL